MSNKQKTDFVIQIHGLMHQYQKNNNIKGQCIQNCQFLYDCITKNNLPIIIKPKAVIVAYNPYPTHTMFHIHMVLQTSEGNIIDPSYEVSCIEKSAYYTSVKDFMEVFKDSNELLKEQKEQVKETVKNYLIFLPFEEYIMSADKPVITDTLHYNLQADWVGEHLKIKGARCSSV